MNFSNSLSEVVIESVVLLFLNKIVFIINK